MTFTSLMTGASSPCLASDLGADLLELLEDFDVVVVAEDRHVLERLAGDLERARCRRCRRAGPQRLAVVLLDRLDDRGLGRDDRLDVVARHELDVVHGEHVGRVGHRDRQRGAGARERNDLVLLRGLGGHELDDGGIDLELAERDGGHAVLLAEERGDLVVFDEAELDQIEAELPPVLALIVQRLLELLRRDALLFEKQLSDANRH